MIRCLKACYARYCSALGCKDQRLQLCGPYIRISLQSNTGVEEGCPLRLILSGLCIYGMRDVFIFSKFVYAPVFSSGIRVTDLAYADVVTLMHVAIRPHLLTGCSSASDIVS